MSNKDSNSEVANQPLQQVPNKPDRKKKGLSKKRDTHFLCFPLVTPTSIPQLAESLRHFRDVSTTVEAATTTTQAPSSSSTSTNQPEIETSDDGNATSSESPATQQEVNTVIKNEDVDNDNDKNNNMTPIHQPYLNPKLQLIPPPAHRPPGTFHLTLGVMDLSTPQAMHRATKLLQEIDYQEIITDLLSQNQQQGREDERKQQQQSSVSQIQTRTENRIQGFKIDLLGLGTFPDVRRARVLYARPRDSTDRTSPPLVSNTPTASPKSTNGNNNNDNNINDDNNDIKPNENINDKSQISLHDFAVQIRQKFRQAGFITETRPLVLHATVANMRYATHTTTTRTTTTPQQNQQQQRGPSSILDYPSEKERRFPKRSLKWNGRVKDDGGGSINATHLVRVFELEGGNADEVVGERDHETQNQNDIITISSGMKEEREKDRRKTGEYVWATGLTVDKLAICKLGAVKSDDPVLGLVYPPLIEVDIFP